MIIIREEEKQTLFGLTNGCICCGASNIQNDNIEEIVFGSPNPNWDGNIYHINGVVVNICKKCRRELLEKLSIEN